MKRILFRNTLTPLLWRGWAGLLIFASLLLTSCGLYDKYEQKSEAPALAFGADVTTTDGSLAQMSWREFFVDPLLQDRGRYPGCAARRATDVAGFLVR